MEEEYKGSFVLTRTNAYLCVCVWMNQVPELEQWKGSDLGWGLMLARTQYVVRGDHQDCWGLWRKVSLHADKDIHPTSEILWGESTFLEDLLTQM